MDVSTIEMQAPVARKHYMTYRRHMKDKKTKQQTREDAAAQQMYRQMAQGRRLLNIADVMRNAGVDSLGRPVLAIARADSKSVSFSRRWVSNTWVFEHDDPPCALRTCEDVHLPLSVLPDAKDRDIRAMVPSIPPDLRPAPDRLKGYFILWDAEWNYNPPKDPFLLRRLQPSGLMFAIVAQWDLTEVERAVLGTMRTP